MYDSSRFSEGTPLRRILPFLLLLCTLPLHAAEVKNLKTGQTGSRGFAQYDLVGKPGEKQADVTVHIELGGERYPADKLSLSGDFGAGVKVGVGKQIFWDVLKDMPAGFEGEAVWDVEASGGGIGASAVAQSASRPAAAATDSSPRGFTDPTTGMEFMYVPGGCYQMGDTFGDGDSNEKPVHEVCVNSFYMGKFEVTNAQYRKFKPGHNSGDYEGNSLNGDNQPVVNVSWNDAVEYARWLSGQSGRSYRLPTEAEWEYAARGGTTTRNYWGNGKGDACGYANVNDLTSKRVNNFSWEHHNCDDGYAVTAPAGSFRPNGFGLYDMMGNVWEWCSDWYDEKYYHKSPRSNPQGSSSGQYRVVRGGSWGDGPGDVRASFRSGSGPGNWSSDFGFRLSLPSQD